MPKIAQYEGQRELTEVVSQPLAADAPADAFGAPVARGVGDIVQAGLQMKKRIDTTTAEEALVGFERDKNDLFFNPDTGYFNTQGRDAYDNSAVASTALEDLKKQYGDELGEASRVMFDKAADAHLTRSNLDINKHASKGLKAWEIATIETQVENTLENASLYWDDPQRLKVQNALGRQAVIDSADMAGIGAEAKNEKLQTYDSAFAKSAIKAATQSSAEAGKTALEAHGDRLEGPAKVQMDKIIKAKVKLEKAQTDAQGAVLTATTLNSQYDTRSDIIDEVNKIEDANLRKKTMTESMKQFSQKKVAKKEVQNDFYQESIALVNKGASPVEIQATNPEAWEGMSNIQQNNILSGKHMITDQVVFNQLRTLPTREKAKLNAVDYSDKLRPSDLQKLTTEIESAKKGEAGSRVKSLSSKSMDAAQSAFGKKAKWTTSTGKATDRGKRANEFISDLQDAIDDEEADKGQRLTPAEENDLISQFTRQIVIERSRFGLDILAADIEFDLSNAPPNDVRTLNRIIDNTPNIDMNDLAGAYQFLVDNEQPVTPNSLSIVYKQGRQ